MEFAHQNTKRTTSGSSVRRAAIVDLAAGAACMLWLFYVLFATTSGFNWLTTWHNEQRAVQVALLAVTAFIAPFCSRQFLRSVRFPRVSSAAVCFLALGLVSAVVARFPAHSLAEIALLVALIGLVVVVWSVASLTPARVISWAFIGLGAAHVVGVLTRYLTAFFLSQPLGMDVLLLGYANPRFPSALYVLLLPFLAYAAGAMDERRSIRVAAFVVLCALWTVNLALATRAIFFAYLVAAPALLFLVGSVRSRRLLWTLAISFILGLLLYWVMFVLVPAWAGLSTAELVRSQAALSGTSGRISLWQAAAALIVANPIFGVGPMHFAAVSHDYGAHPHNSILQFAAEYGVPATLVLVYLVWSVFQASAGAIRRSSSDATHIRVPALLALIVAAIYSLVDGIYLMPVSQSVIAICTGVLFAGTFPRNSTPTHPSHGSPWISRLAGTVIAGSAVYLSAYAVATTEAGTPASGAYSLPRFWEQGYIGPSVGNGLQ